MRAITQVQRLGMDDSNWPEGLGVHEDDLRLRFKSRGDLLISWKKVENSGIESRQPDICRLCLPSPRSESGKKPAELKSPWHDLRVPSANGPGPETGKDAG